MKSLNKRLSSMKKVNGKVKFVAYGQPMEYHSIKRFIKLDKNNGGKKLK